MNLTPARRRALEVVATCTDVVTSNRTDETVPCITIVTADALQQGGLIALSEWNGRAHVCRITDAGRAALQPAPPQIRCEWPPRSRGAK